MLWKKDNPSLTYNRELAVSRLISMEKKFRSNHDFAKLYRDQIEEYIKLGDARKLTNKEKQQTTAVTNYIPHHGVLNPNKPGKVRVVFDAAAKFKNTSLNDNLLTGPDLLNNLITVLCKFRLGKHAVIADIEKMFHQVKVKEKDRDALRFVWRDQEDADIGDYVMNVHLFGKTDSPCCANWALRRTTDGHTGEIVKIIEESFYMDDYLDSFDSEDKAIGICKILIQVLADGGFRLTKWSSNSSNILKLLPSNEIKTSINLDLDELPIERALGMLWNPNTDEFGFKTILKNFPDSKRGILSLIGSIFDPLGIVTPSILEGKLLMQSLWQLKLDWDSPLPDDVRERWHAWRIELSNLKKISIPRWLCTSKKNNSQNELHIFTDASSVAYGAVSYMRTTNLKSVQISFIMGKSRIAPIGKKSMTIPKLELQAAVLGVRMKETIVKSLDIPKIKVYFWTDSQIVLKNITNESRKFPIFIMNRLNEIRISTDIDQWRFIPGELNPADDATRYLPLSSTCDSKWLLGPHFLKEDENNWPNQIDATDKEQPDDVNINVTNVKPPSPKFIHWENYSSWITLVRHVTWLLKLKSNWLHWKRKSKIREDFKFITVKEMKAAKVELYRLSQQESFPIELEKLKSGKPLPSRSKIIPLRPQIEDNLIRVGGRIGLAHIPHDSKHQIILSPKHYISTLIVMHIHENNFHVGRNSTLALTRERFWITSGKSFVRHLIQRCNFCKRRRVKPKPPLMGELPIDRIAYNEPAFSRTGVDYFGPLLVKRGRTTRRNAGTAKRYGALFTCLTTRAVHIEVAGDLSTDSFLLALRRFTSRRGYPKTITSDNGSNFVGAEKEISECLKLLDQNKIQTELAKNEITWKFNPPASPWMGGVFESLVKTTKKALKTVVRDRLFTEEALLTFLVEIESTINSRPLTPVSDDVDDYQALTPNHFLIGRSSPNVPIGNITEKELDIGKDGGRNTY